MMLEGLVAWVLNNYLGKYVENLNTDQLSVAMLSGKVELENLPLKKDALRHLGIPIQVKAGFIGKVKLQVPVRQIRSAPWLIVIEKLYLVAAPVNLDEWDSELEATIEQERKVAILDSLEAQWRAENEAHLDSSYYGASYSSWLSYGTGLLTNIVENLQLKLKDVHIRYEDAITCGERHAFACGLTVESLSAESCDDSWQKGFTVFSSETEGCSFKLIELQKLAVYWDPVPMPTGLLSNYTLSELAVSMSETWNSNHNYIVSPSTAVAYVKRERCEQPLRSKARPRIKCNLTLDQVLLNLTDRQYNESVGCLRGLELIGRWKSFRRRRPHVSVAADARAWWTYAIKCHYPEHHWMEPKPTWESCLARARKTCEYVGICLGILTNPTATLPPDRKATKDEFEWNTPLELLKPLREVAIRAVPKVTTVATTPESNATGRSMLVAWFPQWWGWYGSQPSSQDSDPSSYHAATDNPGSQSVPNLEEEILDVLADSIENNTLLKRDTVFGHFNFTLNKGCLNLSIVNVNSDTEKETESTMLELQFEKVSLGVESRPRTGSHALSVALGTVCLRDKITADTLFPILIAPQGTIREGLSSMNVTSNIMSWYRSHQPPSSISTPAPAPAVAPVPPEPLFQLTYERRPFSSNCDYKLYVKSQSLEVVYNSGSVRWLSEFILKPFSSNNGNGLPPMPITGAYAHMRDTTKMHLMNKWENILQGNLGERSTWQIELDVSAPQIMFVEDFTDRSGIVMVVDFGKMHLTNGTTHIQAPQESLTDDDDIEMFMTPCSTPPGSILSPASPLPLDAPAAPPLPAALDQHSLHRRLYDRYKIELSDLQFLVGRARDNWKYAHTKGTSSLHLLDRFSISLQAERRVVYTSDPQFPSATLCGTLPHLVVHLNEQKLAAVRSILTQITTTPTTQQSGTEMAAEQWQVTPPSDETVSEFSETEHTERSSNQLSKLFMLQFAIDQMALEVQSRGRSIAEVQVCGVRASFTKRPFDYSLSLSVHSLLLVDALQTYGPDFELLVASHKHVGMDCASGSMRDSEPTSPTSPASPDGRYPPSGPQLAPPQALAQALHSLHTTTATHQGWSRSCVSPVMPLSVPGLVDSEALIAVEVTVVRAGCSASHHEELRIANILFNNLDIIANQETIVELIGFAQRVFVPKGTKRVPSEVSIEHSERIASSGLLSIAPQNDDVDTTVRTEITFDFHRLSVLLLRAAVQDGSALAKKIATATMSEAKIQATIGKEWLEVKGSLGGLQVVSLCPGASVHTRILSVGQDPLQAPAPPLDQNARLLSALAQELYRGVSTTSLASSDEKAFVFSVRRTVERADDDVGERVKASVCVHMASVWYTHSGLFIGELQSCVTEFKQYLSNLARSIKAAAADMAIGLVQSRADTLYANPKLSQSMEGVSPRRRTASVGHSLDADSVADCLKSDKIILSIDIELETPVVVLPRAAASTEVFVAHLGKMFLNNQPASACDQHAHHYQVQVRDITLFSLDIGQRLKSYNISADNMQSIYNAGTEGKPVLHNTTLQLSLEHSDVLFEHSEVYEPTTQVTGKIITPLRVSATREQYEQLLETVKTLGVSQVPQKASSETHISEETSTTDAAGVTTLRMDPQLRAQVLSIPPPTKEHTTSSLVNFKGNFQLPSFTVELRGDFGNGERSLVDLSFRDFNVNYEKCHRHETNIQVSLHSITMEDLTQDIESKHRLMMVSHTPHTPKAVFVSKSCPDFATEYPYDEMSSVSSLHLLKSNRYSMPSHLNIIHGAAKKDKRKQSKCGITPPCSPCYDEEETAQDPLTEMSADDNLVLISVHLRDSHHPLFEEKYSRVTKFTKVDFNCLNLVVSMDSWVAVLDFFGIVSDEGAAGHPEDISEQEDNSTHSEADLSTGITETEMSIRSLSVVLLGHRGEVCRANISRLGLQIWGDPAQAKKSVEGSLGSMSLTDLTPHGKIWRERFLTSGKEALNFHYKRLSPEEAAQAEWDTTLSIDMSSVSCVHTKRFVAEIQAFFRDFSLLQRVLIQARQKVSVASKSRSNRMHLSIECRSPLILVPVSSGSQAVLVIDLGRLRLDNSFKRSGSAGTISTISDITHPVREMLDVRIIQLENMDLFCGERRNEPLHSAHSSGTYALPLGRHTHILKRGPSLLTENCRLVLQMENNMESYHNVPDMTIQGTLDTLECALDPEQYKLIKGLLSFNMGEAIDDLNVSSDLADTPSTTVLFSDKTWTLTSIKLDLLNVTLRLETEHKVSSLACINFIKSRLVVETYSDLSQDIDLVSQEILVSDTRYQREPANKRSNVFTSIVQPMGDAGDARHSVQAEVHARKRREHSAYTILVNNMRLMAIMDWWEAVNQFLLQPPNPDFDTSKPMFIYETRDDIYERTSRHSPSDETQIELKLNITESQIVLVEDTSLWDTNAVILKSTTVISYRPGSELKPVSCVLNHCEVFSCVLGMEEETALSIIDPVTLHIDLDANNVLQFQVGTLNVRLSYHDMRMFAGMLQSLPAQARVAGSGTYNTAKPTAAQATAPANSVYYSEAARRLSALGFSTRDCAVALASCSGHMDEAALWLTQNAKSVARPVTTHHHQNKSTGLWPLKALLVRANCITICVIDDCLDSDVPLLEFSFSELTVKQDLRESCSRSVEPLLVNTPQSPPLMSPEAELATELALERQAGPGGGKLKCLFSGDYYNRGLSGWEPIIEPWRCEASWEYALTSSLSRNRLQLEVNSTEVLNVNITSTLIDLYRLVKTNWTQDYYALTPKGESSPKSSPVGYRRRSPFVPFALNNQTGHKLWFTTFVTSSDVINEGDELSEIDDSWMVVRPGETEAFSFGSRRRRGRSAGLRLHQVGVRVDGWGAIGPVCVDRVGVFFRHATHTKSDVEARVVFAVTLEGSARKLVTVRSALQLVNDLPQPIDVRIDSSSTSGTGLLQCVCSKMHGPNPFLRPIPPYLPVSLPNRQWGLMSSRSVQVASGQTWSAPLVPSGLPLWVRPLMAGARHPFLYCAQPLDWRVAARRSSSQTPLLMHHVCHSSGDLLYRFCCIIRREKFPKDRGFPVPGHTLILKPALRIVNLLPIDLHYSIDSTVGAVAPGATEPFHQVNVEEAVEMSFKLDGFANSTLLTLPPTPASSFSTKVKMIDNKGRRLYLVAHISVKRSDTVRVSISAPYWIVNRTGIPIVFRQAGIASETAGQYEEHEIARMVAPLLFSFAEMEGSPTVVARVGSSIAGQSQWCSSFGLGPGTVVRRLVVREGGGAREARAERVCLVGVCVRAGRGRYRRTNICTICPRYQLHNNTSYHLQFAQKCLATSLTDPGASATHLSAISGCYMPFHWPRPDRDQLLCVRPLDAPDCNWSGGFHIDTNNSLHISCRDAYGAYYFLRLEVVLQGATFFVVFTDADTMPPAIRLENFSPVTIVFHQASCKDEVILKPHTSTAWALSEPCGAQALVLGAPGGGRASVELQLPSDTHTLTYLNFIYVAFTATHALTSPGAMSSGIGSAATVEDSQLVLEVPIGTTKVVLGKKRYGDRSQLWRRGPNHQLIHEGSSPPQATNLSGWEEAPLSPHALVLDIEGPAPRPGTATPLALRRADPRRVSTQAWRIAAPGRMCCAHANLCVQPEDGFFGLRPGSRVVLGLPGAASPRVTSAGLPTEQAVSWQTLRPGSGILDISVYADGPTRVIKIVDAKDPDKGWLYGNTIERNRGKVRVESELEVRVALGGLAVSLVSRAPPEELLYALFSGILMELAHSARSQSLNLSIQDVQCDNQLLGTTSAVLLHVTRPRGGSAPPSLPAVHLSLDLTPSPPTRKYNAVIFKHFIISFRPISVRLEEKLLLKLCVWGGLGLDDNSTEELDETEFETHRILNEVTAVHAKRYYFGVIKIVPSQIRLSMQTTSKLGAELGAVKRHLNLTLIKFEDAGVELEPFVRWHPFETGQFLWHLIIKHFKDELKWQAAKILGSVDFLGNPLGFMQDVSEGVSGLIYEGNVGALVKNVTHGISNSAAKVTESLGDGLERVVVDEAHEETRRRIRSAAGGGSHLVAGFRGLGLGLLGGVTSLVKHSYEGAKEDGIQGLLTGMGKGLVGTVTKPVIGVLDLATETASALRDTSRRCDKWVPERMRPTRCPAGAGGLLPRFSRSQSVGHQYLYSINNNDYSEGFLAYECVRDTPLDIRALLSTHYLRIFTCKGATPHIVMETHLSNLVSCVAMSVDNCHLVEMGVRGGAEGAGLRRPRVQCDTAELAAWVARQAAYAKRMYHERQHTLHPHSYV